jgi:hypothetical protein
MEACSIFRIVYFHVVKFSIVQCPVFSVVLHAVYFYVFIFGMGLLKIFVAKSIPSLNIYKTL